MGNYISHSGSDHTGKIILSNGTVHEFNQSVTVAEVMLEHPQQVVVEFGSVGASKKLIPLPADKKLEKEKVYLMLPMKQGKAVPLSAHEARTILLKTKRVLRSGSFLSSTRILPLFTRMCSVGIGVGQEVVLHRKDQQECQLKFFDHSHRPSFLSKQYSGKDWKPTLQTIKEKNAERKISHWLFYK